MDFVRNKYLMGQIPLQEILPVPLLAQELNIIKQYTGVFSANI